MRALLAFLLAPFTAIINGLALKILWGWFIAPFFEVPALNIPMAIGVSIVASYLTHQADLKNRTVTEDDQWIEWIASLLYCIMKPIMALVTGWVVHQFI